MFHIKVFYFLFLCFVLCNSQKNDIIDKIVHKLNAIKSNDVYYINENLFFIKNSNLSELISNINDVNYINDYTFKYNGTHDLSEENATGIYNPSEVHNLTNLFNITNDVFRSHSLILRVNDEVNLKISSNIDGENGLDQDYEADFILENQIKHSARGAQIGFLPIMYVLGVMTTMLKVLTFLTLKGLTIGMVLLTVAYTYSIKKHHAHHGHYAHYGTPATIIKTASHSFPQRHIHVPKYHSHYSSFHHPHHHHYPHHHHPHKKYHYSPDYHHHGHHFKHAPEHIEIVKDVHVHSAKPHLYHKHAPEIHSHEYVKDGPIIEYSPHKHHHSDHHTVKKRYPNPQPAIDHTNDHDNSYDKPPKKSHRPKIHEQLLGPKSPYGVQKDFSKYGAIKEEHPNDAHKENEFNPVNLHNFPPYYTDSPMNYGGGGGEFAENPVNYAPSYVPESYAVNNVVDNYAGGNIVTDYAGSGVVQGYAGGNMGGGYTGSNMVVADYPSIPSSNMATGYVGSSITADYGSSNGAAGYAPYNLLSTYSGGSADGSYNAPAPSPQKDINNEYFTNHKDYMSSNINSEEYSNPVVNSQQVYKKPYATDGEGTNSYQYHNNYSSDQQSKFASPVATSYTTNTDSSYDNVNTYDQSTNEAKYPYSSKNKYTPLLEPENTYKSNASPFFVNIPNLPEEEKSDFEETSDDKKVDSQPNEDSSSYQESMESPIFESSKINNYDSSISSSFSEDGSYNDQQPESYSSSSKNNFDMTDESFNSVLKNKNSLGSSFHQSRDSFSNQEQKTMQELEFEPAWAYILFNNQNSLDNSTSTTSNDLEAETSNPMPSINC